MTRWLSTFFSEGGTETLGGTENESPAMIAIRNGKGGG